MPEKTALITGVTGQDGSYLAEFLLEKGYAVHGIKRRASSFNTARVDHLYHDPHASGRNFTLHYGDLTDTSNITRIIQQVQPDEIYNLGAQSHVKVSFEMPEYTANADAVGVFGYSYLEENLDKVHGLSMNGVEPTYENIASFTYPGARPLFVYVKKSHLDAVPGLKQFVAQWAKMWKKDGPLAKIGLVANPDDVMAAMDKASTEFPSLDGAELK